MTDFCHACGKPHRDRMPLLMAVLAACCLFGWAFSALLAWEIGRTRDRLDRLPQATFLSLPGHYPSVTVYREGWSAKEPDRSVVDPLRKPENKKGGK